MDPTPPVLQHTSPAYLHLVRSTDFARFADGEPLQHYTTHILRGQDLAPGSAARNIFGSARWEADVAEALRVRDNLMQQRAASRAAAGR